MRELSVAEQRYLAVLAVIAEGHPVSSVAQQWGVSRQTLHAWLSRYEEAGWRRWPIGDETNRRSARSNWPIVHRFCRRPGASPLLRLWLPTRPRCVSGERGAHPEKSPQATSSGLSWPSHLTHGKNGWVPIR